MRAEPNIDNPNPFTRENFSADLVAGMTVMVVAVPQAMAYAMIAGMPPVHGLYTAIVCGIVAAICGSSNHLNTGPTNASALMFSSTLAATLGMTALDPTSGVFLPLTAAMFFTFIIGVAKASLGILRVGRVVDYISDSVIVGFTAGAGVLIAGNQLRSAFGIELESMPHDALFVRRVAWTLGHIGDGTLAATIIAFLTGGLILAMKKWTPKLPSALLSLVFSSFVVWLFGIDIKIVGDLSPIASKPPSFIPPVTVAEGLNPIGGIDPLKFGELVGGAYAIAVIGLMEATAISKSIASRTGQKLNPNREFMSQGLANMVGSMFGGFISSGSFTRTAINHGAGGRTRMANVYCGLGVLIMLVALGSFAELVPIAALSGLIIVAAVNMVNKKRLALALRAGWESRATLLTTLLATILMPRIDYAIYLGVAVSLVVFIHQTSRTHIYLLVHKADGHYRETPLDDISEDQIADHVPVFTLNGPLYFSALEDLQRRLIPVADMRPRAVVLRLRHVTGIDSSGLAALFDIHERLAARDIPFLLCGVNERMMTVFGAAGLIDTFGQDRVMPQREEIFESMEGVLQRANL